MLRLPLIVTLLALAACSVVSDEALLDFESALILREDLDETIDVTMPDEEGGPINLRSATDRRTLRLTDVLEPQETIYLTLHPLPSHDGFIIAQGSFDSNPGYGYILAGCDQQQQVAIYLYEYRNVVEQLTETPIEGLTTNGLYTARASSTEALYSYFELVLAQNSLSQFEFEPEIPCDLIFE